MKSHLFEKATIQMEKACNVNVVLAIISTYHRDLPFDESVELIDMAVARLNIIYKVK